MRTIYTVSHVTAYLKELLDYDPLVGDVWLRGEVSNFIRARSGHCYFTIKDENAQLRCVMWRSTAVQLATLPRDGDAVVVRGRITLYPERGDLQLYVEEMEPVGLGVLYQRFEELKARLEAEGLFDDGRKRPLPSFPRRIGVVTSPGAAAWRDILNVLARRHPLVEVVLSPTLVQGSEAPSQIATAIARFDRVPVDVVIVARGGGSLEELWAFNEEIVARAICACRVPVISGVGHEIDFTIADFVADQRAPTPSAAAELAVPDIRELRTTLAIRKAQLAAAIENLLEERANGLRQERRALERVSPQSQLDRYLQRLDELNRRLEMAIGNRLALQESALKGLQGKLAGLNPFSTLARGYAVVAEPGTGRLIRSAADVAPGDALVITVQEGQIPATVGEPTREEHPG
jgi:exodeoxyribonuclease VII large subunit